MAKKQESSLNAVIKAKDSFSDAQKEIVSKLKVSNPLSKLSKSEWVEVFQHMEERDGNKSMREIAEEHIREYLEESIKNASDSYRNCSKEEHVALVVYSSFPHFPVERGVARRICFNNPAELAICMCIQARMAWLSSYCDRADNCYPNIWPLLNGLSAGDFTVAQKIFPNQIFSHHTWPSLHLKTLQWCACCSS